MTKKTLLVAVLVVCGCTTLMAQQRSKSLSNLEYVRLHKKKHSIKKNRKLTIPVVNRSLSNDKHDYCNDSQVALMGKYIEVGVGKGGFFGTKGLFLISEGYHKNNVGFLTDSDKDGWDVGSPTFFGDFFLPGSPEESFTVQYNGRKRINSGSGGTAIPCNSHTKSFKCGKHISTWIGKTDGLKIKQRVSFRHESTYFLVSIELENTTSSTIKDVYYLRNVDPDNTVDQGGDYTTKNKVWYQPNTDLRKRALVSATSVEFPRCFLGIAAIDERARVTYSTGGGLKVTDPVAVYNGTGLYKHNGGITQDLPISISFKIGDIAPNEKALVEFAYVLDANGVDNAFTDLAKLKVNSYDISHKLFYNISSTESIKMNIEDADSYTWEWSCINYPEGLSKNVGYEVLFTPKANSSEESYQMTAIGKNECDEIKKFIFEVNFKIDDNTPPLATVPNSYESTTSKLGDIRHLITATDNFADPCIIKQNKPYDTELLSGETTPIPFTISDGTNEVSKTINVTYNGPATPVSKMAVTKSSTSVEVSWDAANLATSYILEVSTSSGFYTLVGTYPSTTTDTKATVSGLSENTVYYYRVKAKNAIGESSYSDIIPFEVNKFSKDKIAVAFDAGSTDFTYTGEDIIPNFTLKDGANTLTKDVDYTQTLSNNKNAGKATVTFTGKSSGYAGCSFSVDFNIIARDISTADITTNLNKENEYTGLELNHLPTVKLNGKILVENTDYTVTYEGDFTYPGFHSITINGKAPNNIGTTSNQYLIFASLNNENITVEPIANLTYTSSLLQPEAKIKINNHLIEKSNYTLQYSSNRNVGLAKATIIGKDGLKGSKHIHFSIEPKTIGFSVNSITDEIYTGEALKPTPIVKDGTITLIENADYIVIYDANRNVGTANVIIKGIGNYKGSTANSQFTIKTLNNTLVIAPVPSVNYNRLLQTPEANVFYNGKRLTQDTDFTVSYASNKNVGTGIITVRGLGNFAGLTASRNFIISPQNITASNINFEEIATQSYTGSSIKPIVKIKDNGNLLLLNTDYSVTYNNNIERGYASVIIKGLGNYTDEFIRYYKIKERSCVLSFSSIAAQTYTGKNIEPDFAVYDGAKTLILNKDYTVNYHSNIEVGIANVTVKGIGNYAENTNTTTFTIKPRAIIPTLEIRDYTYTGQPIVPYVIVHHNGKILPTNAYTITATNNINAGKATAVITMKSNYTGVGSQSFNILSRNISFEIDNIANQTYTGLAIKPQITVKDGATLLIENVDYRCNYMNNTEVGTSHIYVTGIGNYEGSNLGVKTFEITPATQNLTIAGLTDQTYQRSPITPECTVTDEKGNTLEIDKDYEIIYNNNLNRGNAHVSVIGRGNYKGSNATATFAIQAKTITPTLHVNNAIYTGSDITPQFIVMDGSQLLTPNDYDIALQDNQNIGEATLTVTLKGNYNGSNTKTFEIISRNTILLTDDIANQIYTGTAIEPTLIVKDGTKILAEGIDYTLHYINNTHIGAASVIITGEGNYVGNSNIKNFKIVPNVCTFDIPAIDPQVYTRNAITPTIIVNDNHGNSLVMNQDYVVNYSNNIDNGTATIEVKGIGNYEGSTGTRTFTIAPKPITPHIITFDEYYTGSAITPRFTVSDNGITLTPNDYNVGVANNINVGKGTVNIIMKGNYTGSTTSDFNIKSRILTLTINDIVDQTYTGTAIEPEIIVKDGTKTLMKGIDYKYELVNNVNIGKATLLVNGINNYEGSSAVTKQFNIVARNCELAVANIDNQTFNRNPIQPIVKVKDDLNQTLVLGKDYQLIYDNNINSGTASVTITGIGNYKGSEKVALFTITPKTVTPNLSVTEELHFKRALLTPKAIVSDGKDLLLESDYEISYSNNYNAGEATCKITLKGNYIGENSTHFTILSRNITFAVEDIESYTYTGHPIIPTVIAKDGTKALVDQEDYNYKFVNNINVGVASVFVSGLGNYSGSNVSTATFEIKPKAMTFTIEPIQDQIYNLVPLKPELIIKDGKTILVKDKDYSVEYTNNVIPGTATATITGKGNYEGSIGQAEFKVVPHPYHINAEEIITEKASEGEPLSATHLQYKGAIPGTIEFTDAAHILCCKDNCCEFTWKFTPKDIIGYLPTTGKATVSVVALPVISIEQEHNICVEERKVYLPYTIIKGEVSTFDLIFDTESQKAGFHDILDQTPTDENEIYVEIPNLPKRSHNNATLRVKNELGKSINTYPLTLHMLRSDMIIQKWNDVLICNNSSQDFVAYQWIKEGAPINGANKQFYQEKGGLKGLYQVEATTKDGEKVLSCETFFDLESNGKSSLYPAPAHCGKSITVTNPNYNETIETVHITIVSTTGAVVNAFDAPNGYEINIGSLSQEGTYIVNIKLGNKTIVHNFIVIR